MTWPGTQSSVQQSQAREIARQTSQTGPSLICFIMFYSFINKQPLVAMILSLSQRMRIPA
jgi:hypothetical protein